jgi:hypothetical protein
VIFLSRAPLVNSTQTGNVSFSDTVEFSGSKPTSTTEKRNNWMRRGYSDLHHHHVNIIVNGARTATNVVSSLTRTLWVLWVLATQRCNEPAHLVFLAVAGL